MKRVHQPRRALSNGPSGARATRRVWWPTPRARPRCAELHPEAVPSLDAIVRSAWEWMQAHPDGLCQLTAPGPLPGVAAARLRGFELSQDIE